MYIHKKFILTFLYSIAYFKLLYLQMRFKTENHILLYMHLRFIVFNQFYQIHTILEII